MLLKSRLILMMLLLLAGILLPNCRPRTDTGGEEYRLEFVREIKAFEARLGFKETSNFQGYSEKTESYDYYFYAPATRLPYSMGDPLLEFGLGTAENVTLDRNKYDIFFYSIQALAGIDTPVTKSLMDSPLDRFIHVIIHEDWHEQIDLPSGIEEPSGEVVSYAAAMLFSQDKFGKDSNVYKSLKKEFESKVNESQVYIQYYDRLSTLYARFESGALSESDTLTQKRQLLESMGERLQGIWGAKPEGLNNAFLAFQMTYMRYLPLMHRVFSSSSSDLPKTLSIFRGMPGQGADSSSLEKIKEIEKQVVDYLQRSLPASAILRQPGKVPDSSRHPVGVGMLTAFPMEA